jgi:hypothetical protein
LLDEVTTYDVVHRREVKPGKSNMWQYCEYSQDVAEKRHAIVAGIDTSSAQGWDLTTNTRQWRQRRYDAVIKQGKSQREAIFNSLCNNFSGFIDDGQLSTIACFMPLVIATLLRLVEIIGVRLSVEKLQWAKDGKLFVATALQEKVQRPEHIQWQQSQEADAAICLGRLMDATCMCVRDTPERIAELKIMSNDLLSHGRDHSAVSFQFLRTYLGITMYVVQLQVMLRCLVSSLWKVLTVKTRYKHTKSRGGKELDHLVPWTDEAAQDVQMLQDGLDANEGQVYAPSTSAPDGSMRPVITILNDAAGDAKDNGVSYRAGASWLYKPGLTRTMWAQYQWDYETQLQGQHSTLLELVNGNMTLAAVVEMFPGHDIVEVYDNQAVSKLLVTLATKAHDLREPLRYRRTLMQRMHQGANVYIHWVAREYLTLSDDMSKNNRAAFVMALYERGLPPPKAFPFSRPQPHL